MSAAPKHTAYSRKAFLAQVSDADRPLATRLCDLLEAAFPLTDIMLYGGGAMPIVVRDMEWIAGFAMRKAHPVAYCCSPAVREAMGAELEPYMSGKSCVAVKPRKGESLEVVLEIVGRAFREASRHGGVISKTDAKRRERMRRGAAEAGGSAARKSTAKTSAESPAETPTAAGKPTVRKPAAKKSATRKSVTRKPATRKSATKKLRTKKPTTRKLATKVSATKTPATRKSPTRKSPRD